MTDQSTIAIAKLPMLPRTNSLNLHKYGFAIGRLKAHDHLSPAHDGHRLRWLREQIKSAPACRRKVAAMGSLQPPKTAFSNDDLVELEWVFASVCEELETKNCKQDDDDKQCIRRRLFVLACNGMTDPRTLRDHLVRSFTRPAMV